MSLASILSGSCLSRRSGLIIGLGAALSSASTVSAASLTILGNAAAGGYQFLNFDFPGAGTNAAAGTNVNGIANTGAVVGFTIDNNGNFANFIGLPYSTPPSALPLATLNASGNGMAFGINRAGDVVGTLNGAAVLVPHGGGLVTISTPPGATAAFGINDQGAIVGQYALSGGQTPSFVLPAPGASAIRVNSPLGPRNVNAQGINNHGLIAGFYVGLDGQDHGLEANLSSASHGILTGQAIADPTIPNVPGEPGATFAFSQILGINDQGIAVGYYGDSTTSQHGFLYNTNTGQYMFLDDPAQALNNGVEITQITGINNLDEITGFYSDANGVFHGFTACPDGVTCGSIAVVPESGTWRLMALGFLGLGLARLRGCGRSRVAFGRLA